MAEHLKFKLGSRRGRAGRKDGANEERPSAEWTDAMVRAYNYCNDRALLVQYIDAG